MPLYYKLPEEGAHRPISTDFRGGGASIAAGSQRGDNKQAADASLRVSLLLHFYPEPP